MCDFIGGNMKEIVRTETGTLWVGEENRGKTLILMADTEEDTMDVIHIGISWDSLKKLKQRSARKFFEWEIKDGSLKVHGRNDKWKLTLKSLQLPISIDLMLSVDETKRLQEALWSTPGEAEASQ